MDYMVHTKWEHLRKKNLVHLQMKTDITMLATTHVQENMTSYGLRHGNGVMAKHEECMSMNKIYKVHCKGHFQMNIIFTAEVLKCYRIWT
jgi:hypothetical protein